LLIVIPAFTAIDNCALAVAAAESVTFTVKLAVPAAVGFPATTPPEERVIPSGNEVPEDTDQLYPEPDPPLALRVVDV
jgi:hypothetical protein